MDRFGRAYPPKCGEYHVPRLTTDAIVFRLHAGEHPQVLMVTRGRPPYQGKLAFPGGFINYNEDPRDACLRELKEEAGVTGRIVGLVDAAGDPLRDPRHHTISIVYRVEIEEGQEVVAGDDAAEARFYSVQDLLTTQRTQVAFDHAVLLSLAVSQAHILL